jgi:hypothetical protein
MVLDILPDVFMRPIRSVCEEHYRVFCSDATAPDGAASRDRCTPALSKAAGPEEVA